MRDARWTRCPWWRPCPPGVDGLRPGYVTGLMAESTVPRGTAEHYARIVAGLALLREVQRVATQMMQEANEATWDTADKPLAAARAAIDAATDQSANVGVRTFSEAVSYTHLRAHETLS